MATDTTARSSAPAPPPSEPPSLSPVELARWAWRQLTSMRTALILLFLLALAAVPGSVVPQSDVDPGRVSRWQQQHPRLTPVYEWLGLFSVYDSVWFSAIYILLMVSLVGCIVPRTRVYWRALRAQPPRTPRRLDRLPHHEQVLVDASPEEVLELARERLRGRRYRLRRPDADGPSDSVSAERGYLREAGNLVFHLAIIVVLVGFAMGSLMGFRASKIVVVGSGFSNNLSQYDEFSAGPFFDPSDLAPFDVTIDDFDLTFIEEGRQRGMASQFEAETTYRSSIDGEPEKRALAVNHPLRVDDTDVFLIGHGYAPQITVRDAKGDVVTSGPRVFLPEDATFRSFGVLEVPDGLSSDGKDVQLGLEGEFYPTYVFIRDDSSPGGGLPTTAFPDAKNPVISMLAYTGDLGIDGGVPKSAYALDKAGLSPLTKADGKPLRIDLMLGQTVQLPDGLGSVSFDGLQRFVKLDVSETPGQTTALVGVITALLGLLGSLYIRPRRIWVRARREGGRTLVSVAGLDRSSGGDLTGELDALVAALQTTAPEESS